MKRIVVVKDPESAGLRRSGKLRAALTMLCALAADGLQWLIPPLWPVCDAAMVIAMLVLWGWRWEILVAVIPELIPGLDLFPTWTLFAGYIVLRRSHDQPGYVAPRPERPFQSAPHREKIGDDPS